MGALSSISLRNTVTGHLAQLYSYRPGVVVFPSSLGCSQMRWCGKCGLVGWVYLLRAMSVVAMPGLFMSAVCSFLKTLWIL